MFPCTQPLGKILKENIFAFIAVPQKENFFYESFSFRLETQMDSSTLTVFLLLIFNKT